VTAQNEKEVSGRLPVPGVAEADRDRSTTMAGGEPTRLAAFIVRRCALTDPVCAHLTEDADVIGRLDRPWFSLKPRIAACQAYS
jgi:hypothetical protein